jgi:hypothetical protein
MRGYRLVLQSFYWEINERPLLNLTQIFTEIIFALPNVMSLE